MEAVGAAAGVCEVPSRGRSVGYRFVARHVAIDYRCFQLLVLTCVILVDMTLNSGVSVCYENIGAAAVDSHRSLTNVMMSPPSVA